MVRNLVLQYMQFRPRWSTHGRNFFFPSAGEMLFVNHKFLSKICGSFQQLVFLIYHVVSE